MFKRLFIVALLMVFFANQMAEAKSKMQFEITFGASFCEEEWGYTAAVGQWHIHSYLSTPEEFGEGSIDPKEFDHILSGDPAALVESIKRLGLKVNFVLFSEHGENMTDGGWALLGDLAGKYATDPLIVGRGFEWTFKGAFDAEVNHINVWGTSRYAGIEPHRAEWNGERLSDLASFYQWLENNGDDWVGVFNHPWLGKNHFDNFRYPDGKTRLRERMALLEVAGGPTGSPHQFSMEAGEKRFREAIRKGWRVGPSYGADNFDNPFESRNYMVSNATVLWAQGPALDERIVREAALSRRCYARVGSINSANPCEIKFAARGGGEWVVMGDRLTFTAGAPIECQLWTRSPSTQTSYLIGVMPDGKDWKIELPRPKDTPFRGDKVVAATVRFVVPEDTIAIYVKVFGSYKAISAPIWMDGQLSDESDRLDSVAEVVSGGGMTGNEGLVLVNPDQSAIQAFSLFPIEKRAIIHLASGGLVSIKFRRHAGWDQGVRISINGLIVYCHLFAAEWEESEFLYKSIDPAAVELNLEPFNNKGRGWERTTLFQFPSTTSGDGVKIIKYEDGRDTDFDDLVVGVKYL